MADTGSCWKVGDLVWVHYRSAKADGTITKVLLRANTCARSRFMVHETHTTVDGVKLVHDKPHFGSALHHREAS